MIVVRTDYTDDAAWLTINELLKPEDWSQLLDDQAWDGASVEEILAALPDVGAGVVFVADSIAMREPFPLLAVSTVTQENCEDQEEYDYEMQFGREFRLLPIGVSDVFDNLWVGNMDFPEFAAWAEEDPHGCYRGLAAYRDLPEQA